MTAFANAISSFLSTAVTLLLALLTTFTGFVSYFFGQTEVLVAACLNGNYGVWGYAVLALLVIAILDLGVYAVLASIFRGALVYATGMFLLNIYHQSFKFGERLAAQRYAR